MNDQNSLKLYQITLNPTRPDREAITLYMFSESEARVREIADRHLPGLVQSVKPCGFELEVRS